jgi:hypothetical protein
LAVRLSTHPVRWALRSGFLEDATNVPIPHFDPGDDLGGFSAAQRRLDEMQRMECSGRVCFVNFVAWNSLLGRMKVGSFDNFGWLDFVEARQASRLRNAACQSL